MNHQATLDKLNAMRLRGMKEAFVTYLESSISYSSEELIAHLADAEWLDRENRKQERLRRNAALRYEVPLTGLDLETPRGLDKTLVLHLASGAFIRAHEDVLITGPTGVGKSYICCALGHQACLHGYKTLYFNLRKLLAKLKAAMADGSYLKLIAKIEKHDLLIIDDFGLQKLDANARQILLEIIEDRHLKRSTIVASQLPVAEWYQSIGDSAVADAILDRLVHKAHRIELKGDSWRKRAARKH